MYYWDRRTESIREFKVVGETVNGLIIELKNSLMGGQTTINKHTELYAQNEFDLLRLVEADLQRQLRAINMMKDEL